MGKKDKTQTRHVFQIKDNLVPLVFWGPWTSLGSKPLKIYSEPLKSTNLYNSTGPMPLLDVRFAISRQAVRNCVSFS